MTGVKFSVIGPDPSREMVGLGAELIDGGFEAGVLGFAGASICFLVSIFSAEFPVFCSAMRLANASGMLTAVFSVGLITSGRLPIIPLPVFMISFFCRILSLNSSTLFVFCGPPVTLNAALPMVMLSFKVSGATKLEVWVRFNFPNTALNSGSALLLPVDAGCRDLRLARKSVFGGVCGFALSAGAFESLFGSGDVGSWVGSGVSCFKGAAVAVSIASALAEAGSPLTGVIFLLDGMTGLPSRP